MTATSTEPTSVQLFYSYAHEDRKLRDRLDKHLATLTAQGIIIGWHDRMITAGASWDATIRHEIEASDVILLLVSPDFLASDYCRGVEVARALSRHEEGSACVIPVILQPCDWQYEKFGKLQAVPSRGRPVATWPNRNSAFLDVVRGIRKAIGDLKKRAGSGTIARGETAVAPSTSNDQAAAARSPFESSEIAEGRTSIELGGATSHSGDSAISSGTSSGISPANALVGTCPLCGDPHFSGLVDGRPTWFACRQCGRSPICRWHRDAELLSCSECAKVRVNPVDGAKMVWIPAGEFLMGDDDMEDNPRHTVKLSGFWMYKNLVTVGQYKAFCAATKRKMPDAPSFNPKWSKEDHPIVEVNWGGAAAYARWAKVDLPTEAQWEKAARGTDGREYPWGDGWEPSRCRCSQKDRWDAGGTAPVGSYLSGASPYGCRDMAGNVWEWCDDWYDGDYWTVGHGPDPGGPAAGTHRVLRGGSWYICNPYYFRAAYRDIYVPTCRDVSYDGFRCVGRADFR